MPETLEKAPWLAEGDEKRREVRRMFNDIAPSYDLVNSLMSFRLHHRWRQSAVGVLGLKPGDAALDLCCGTGDFLVPLRAAVGPNGRVVGVDFSDEMLRIAHGKLGDGVQLSLADACDLPIASESFEAVSVGWGLRNVPDISKALHEAARVLKPNGRFVTLDMARPRGAVIGKVSEWVFHSAVPLIGRLFGKSTAYRYLPKSTLKFLSREEMTQAMTSAGFRDVKHRDFFFGNICMHWGVKA